jgi:hypothetical protein
MNTTGQTFTSTFPAGVDLRAAIDDCGEGNSKQPKAEEIDAFTPTEKSAKLFVGALERLVEDVARRSQDGPIDARLVSDIKIVGDLLIRIEQTNLAARRLALAEAKQSARRQSARPAPAPTPNPAPPDAKCKPSSRKTQDSGLPAPSLAATAAKPHPSGLKPNTSRIITTPSPNSRKIERLFSRPSRPIALQAAREQIDSDPEYPEYLKAKEEGWQPSPQIQESNRRIAEIQKREEEAWLAKPSCSSSVFELLPGGPVAPIVDSVDDSKPSQGELLTAIYETDPNFAHYKWEKAYHAAHAAAPLSPATHPMQDSATATEHSGNDP